MTRKTADAQRLTLTLVGMCLSLGRLPSLSFFLFRKFGFLVVCFGVLGGNFGFMVMVKVSVPF